MKTALLLIDIQNDYFPGGKMENEGAVEAAKKARTLLEAFREKGMPVFHVQHESIHANATFFLPGTGGMEIHSLVAPLPGERVILKHHPNSFRETGLAEALTAGDIDRLVIAGMMSHMCVNATTRAAAELGFGCAVASDACATKALSFMGLGVPACMVHAAFMAALSGAFADVKPAGELLCLLDADRRPAI